MALRSQQSFSRWSKSVAVTAQKINSLSQLFPPTEGFSSLIFTEVNQWPSRHKKSILTLSCSLRSGFQFFYLHWSKSVAITAQKINSLSQLFPPIEGFSSLLSQLLLRSRVSVLSSQLFPPIEGFSSFISDVPSDWENQSSYPYLYQRPYSAKNNYLSCSPREGFQFSLFTAPERSSSSFYSLYPPSLEGCQLLPSYASAFSFGSPFLIHHGAYSTFTKVRSIQHFVLLVFSSFLY